MVYGAGWRVRGLGGGGRFKRGGGEGEGMEFVVSRASAKGGTFSFLGSLPLLFRDSENSRLIIR